MLVHNSWIEAKLVNGAVGYVHDIIFKAGEGAGDGPPAIPEAILVRVPDQVHFSIVMNCNPQPIHPRSTRTRTRMRTRAHTHTETAPHE